MQSDDDTYIQRIIFTIQQGFKVLIVVRGLPGSGKTTLANSILTACFGTIEARNDHIFDVDVDTPTMRTRVIAAIVRGVTPILVDGVHLEMEEIRPFAEFAAANEYFFDVIETTTSWRFHGPTLHAYTHRTLTLEQIELMIVKYETNGASKDVPTMDMAAGGSSDVSSPLNFSDSSLKVEMSSDCEASSPRLICCRSNNSDEILHVIPEDRNENFDIPDEEINNRIIAEENHFVDVEIEDNRKNDDVVEEAGAVAIAPVEPNANNADDNRNVNDMHEMHLMLQDLMRTMNNEPSTSADDRQFSLGEPCSDTYYYDRLRDHQEKEKMLKQRMDETQNARLKIYYEKMYKREGQYCERYQELINRSYLFSKIFNQS